MAEDTALTELLSQFDATANAPLTGSRREARAKLLLESAGFTFADIGEGAFAGGAWLEPGEGQGTRRVAADVAARCKGC
jgi:hypothetical protein